MDENGSLSHTKWECKYHVVFMTSCSSVTSRWFKRIGAALLLSFLTERHDAGVSLTRRYTLPSLGGKG